VKGPKLAGPTTDRQSAGVRPSSGAAISDPLSALEDTDTSLLADVAAPEDGRTPILCWYSPPVPERWDVARAPLRFLRITPTLQHSTFSHGPNQN